MSTIEIGLAGGGTCDVRHRESGARMQTSKAPEYGGRGDGFSSTDLLAAALGSCIASNLEPVALRHGVPLDAIRLTVYKRLGTMPKRIVALTVRIEIDAGLDRAVYTRLERAAHQCVVHRSLSKDVEMTIELAGP